MSREHLVVLASKKVLRTATDKHRKMLRNKTKSKVKQNTPVTMKMC